MNVTGKETILNWGRVILGVFMMALAVNLVFEPMGMVTGGVSGVAIIVRKLTGVVVDGGVPVWLTNLVLNVPILLFAWKVKGNKYVLRVLAANVIFALFMMCIPVIDWTQKDYVLGVLAGGVLNGLGLGLVFSVGGSTGGTDLMAAIVHHYIRYYSVAQFLFVLDGLVVLCGAWVFGIRSALYAVAAIFVTSKIMDGILEGMHFARAVLVISGSHEQIGCELMEKLDRGVTQIPVKGMYTGHPRQALLCVTGKKQVPQLTKIVRKTDPSAFVIISDIHEVLGEGFVEIGQL